jgi:hypothetical protein
MVPKCGFLMHLLLISLLFGQKNEEGRIHGLIVERGMEGFTNLKLIINGRFVHHQLRINF